MQSLEQLGTRDDIKQALDSLTPETFQGLDKIYEQMFERVKGTTDGFYPPMLQHALSWLLLANRRLSRAELRDVLCWSDMLYPFGLSDVLSNEPWIVEDGRHGELDFIHPTAKAYLRRVHPTLCTPEVGAELLDNCVRYLARPEFSEGPCSSQEELTRRLELFPFYSYAARYWGHHALRPSVASLGVTHSTRSFLKCPGQVAAAGQILREPFPVWGPTALHLSSYMGIVNIVRLLLTDNEFGQNPNQKDDFDRAPLAWAARNCHIDVMTLLLQHGAYIDARDQNGSTALAYAIAQPEHECARKTSRFLIDLGAYVNSQDEFGSTPLSKACWIGHLGIAELLLQRGAHVNLRDGNGRSPLWQASRAGHSALVKLLIRRGADLTVKDDWEETPILAAIQSGAAPVLQQLLDAGVLITNREYLITQAKKRGSSECVRILLGLGTSDADSDISDTSTDFPSSAPAPVANPDNVIDDAHTEYSEVGPFTESQRERLIVGLAVDLADRVLPDAVKVIDAAAAERMRAMLPRSLKHFALKIGYEPRDDDAKKIMYIVHKYKR